ncbi:unnamed protein product [Caenorhabditis nigoni]
MTIMSSNYPPASQADVREVRSLSKEGLYFQIERIWMGMEPDLKELVEKEDTTKARDEERKQNTIFLNVHDC